MKNQLLTEDEVKRQLHIDDFRHLKKEQVIEFVSALPNMDKEVAIKCVEQFPHFKEYSNKIVSHYYELCNESIKRDGKESVEAYKKTLEELQGMLNRPFIFKKERQQIIEKMIEVGQHIERVEDKKRSFTTNVVRSAAAVAGIAITVGAAIIGVGSGIISSD